MTWTTTTRFDADAKLPATATDTGYRSKAGALWLDPGGDAYLVNGGKVERCDGPWRSSGDWWHQKPWNCDEWDVALSDGVSYRISQAREDSAWFIDGMLD